MSAEIEFQEVVSNSATEEEPLGTLAGRGFASNKKGGLDLDEAISELEEAMKPKTCAWCLFVKITLNSVICGKSGTYKEYDDYCKYHKQKDNA